MSAFSPNTVEKDPKDLEHLAGYYLRVNARNIYGQTLRIVAVYCPNPGGDNTDTRKSVLQQLRADLADGAWTAGPTLVAGDFNTALYPGDRLTGDATQDAAYRAAISAAPLHTTDPWAPGKPARARTFSVGENAVSRIDDIFVSSARERERERERLRRRLARLKATLQAAPRRFKERGVCGEPHPPPWRPRAGMFT
jgi:hypothetical protein